MRIAICDDEMIFREQISEIVKDYAAQHPDREISFNAFDSADALIDTVQRIGGFDIYILDIVMPEMNGIELGSALRRMGSEGIIIYLTSSREFGVDSYSVKAFNYILKPLHRAELNAVLDDAVASVSNRKEKSLIVKTNESSVKLSLDSILYAQLNRRVVSYCLIDGKTVDSILIRTTFSEAVQDLLRDSRIVLCGASIVANLHHISMIEKDALLFGNSTRLYIPRKACGAVRSAWYDYWFDGEGSK